MTKFFLEFERDISVDECYRFIGPWIGLECDLMSSVISKYDLPLYLLPEEEAAISDNEDIGDDDLAELLKFLLIKDDDNGYHLFYGNKRLLNGEDCIIQFSLMIESYFAARLLATNRLG